MRTRSKLELEGQARHQVIAHLRLGLKKIAEIRFPLHRSISVDMFASDCLPYEASKTYRTIMTEFDRQRAQVRKEAQMALLHGT